MTAGGSLFSDRKNAQIPPWMFVHDTAVFRLLSCPSRANMSLTGRHPGKTGNGGFGHEGIWRDGAAWEIHAGGLRRLVKEPQPGIVHPQVEAAAEKEGEAGVPRRVETAGLGGFPGHKLHKSCPGCLCSLWRELTCYYPHPERICVLPKGKTKKQNGGNAHAGTGIYGETRDQRVKGEDL